MGGSGAGAGPMGGSGAGAGPMGGSGGAAGSMGVSGAGSGLGRPSMGGRNNVGRNAAPVNFSKIILQTAYISVEDNN